MPILATTSSIRRVNVLALNNTWLPSNNTVLTLRYGMTKFIDDDTLSIDFNPSTLGFSQNFLDQTQVDKYPIVNATEYRFAGRDRPDAPQLVLLERQRHATHAWLASTR